MMNRVLVAGMPNSGKSTFIGALRHVLVAQDIPSALELTNLSSNETHLNKLENDWLDGTKVPRTQSSTETWVEFKLRDNETGNSVTLALPDLRGESFEQPATLGRCDDELLAEIVAADGLMLFTNADREDDKLMISDVADILEGDPEPQPPVKAKKFDPREMPEEAKIVELLQYVNRAPRYGKRRRLALLISAWDVVETSLKDEPDAWLASNCAMLEQFLRYNADLWEVRVYGVSAQGGKLPRDRERLLKITKPSERIRIKGYGAHAHDITSPLRWLISGPRDS